MKKLILCVALLMLAGNIEGFAKGYGYKQPSSSSYKSVSYRSSYKPIFYKSSYSSPKATYKVGSTKYVAGETYKTTGMPKVERSQSEKKKFLKSLGYKKVPTGYDVDHVQPLSKSGADSASNMQLIPKEVHKVKTAQERKR